ncbi:long-chain-acyl-CoA synthetase [Aliidiomarina celeris]|uniref:long-chain-acyl-CoA synthetase n=1 Tax=Aliidiomarina celeris TaxID=2249428 RepID=UPI000DE8E343|nr:long-chain-acyl-CoA synthetase [Aliidiomarina celeris]
MNAHTFPSIALAAVKMIPRLPRFLRSNLKLARAKHSDIGSTALFLEKAAAAHAERDFLVFENERYSYGQFNRWANQIARVLEQKGIKRGDCVGILFENRPALLACVFAVNKLGAIAGMLNFKQRSEVLEHSVNLVKPKLVIVGDECAETWRSVTTPEYASLPRLRVADAVTVPVTDADDLMALAAQCDEHNLPYSQSICLGETCYYVFTSGTTGLPKAAAMTHLRWYKAGVGFGQMALGLKGSKGKQHDTLYCALPLYHNTALAISLSCVVLTSATLALARKFSVSQFWRDIEKHQATCFSYIGEVCRYLLQAPAASQDSNKSIRAVIGNGLRAEIWDDFQQRFNIPRICELYGASEGNVGFVNAFNLKRTVGFSPMTFAVVQFNVDTEEPVVTNDGYCQRVVKGEVGLLLTEVSRKAPFDGYTNKEANQAKLLHNVFKPGDCWFNTGDLVRDQGFRHIAFVDRVGDTFRWKAENVATTEVEAQIQTISGIQEVVVYGVQVPNADGRAGMASLVVAPEQAFNPVEFYQGLKAKLPDYAIPLFLRLSPEHEVTTTFKVMKTQLKQQGYRVVNAREQVFVLLDKALGYEPLSTSLLQRIERGQVRF